MKMKLDKGAILASMAIIALASVLVGAGTMAYFSKTNASGPNVIQAATIDIALTVDFELTDIYPSKELDPITVTFENVGPIPGYMYTKVTYTNNDDPLNPVKLTADEFAALIYIETVTYEHYAPAAPPVGYGGWSGSPHDDLPDWKTYMDGIIGNDDGEVSLYEMALCGWIPYDVHPTEESLPVGEGGRWVITLHMADSLYYHVWGDATKPKEPLKFDVEDNAPQADGINLTFTVLLKSSPGSP